MTSDEPPAQSGWRPEDEAAAGPREPEHGLWLARQVADQMTLRCDARGTSAVITFSVPAILIPATPP